MMSLQDDDQNVYNFSFFILFKSEIFLNDYVWVLNRQEQHKSLLSQHQTVWFLFSCFKSTIVLVKVLRFLCNLVENF